MILKIDNISKNFGRKVALKDISFSLEDGVYGLLGDNGAGKSTLMRILTTVLKPSSGSVEVDGNSIKVLGDKYRSLLGYMPQEFFVYPTLTARGFLEYMSSLKGINEKNLKNKIDEVLEFVNLKDVANKRVVTFSGGMKRRIGIAQAIINNPKIIILDEPTAGLDPQERIRFLNILGDMGKNKIIIISTHIVSEIEAISRDVIVMKKGKLVEKGDIDTLVETMASKVWEAEVEQNDLKEIEKNNPIIKMKRKNEKIRIRYVGEKIKEIENKKVLPTLEDYYVYNNNKIGGENEKID
ncbi:MAG: ABC transporter ATP-binding protein [Miniphocaeibacter sp.]|uniref:ABC transporter ATP-binding protein n=1 Tax=Miniphocaeibacter sp. TaxID=3100973 RepID=UPI00184DEAAD|nr:ABC transporter ATP-binding protein [Gallicola sp.]